MQTDLSAGVFKNESFPSYLERGRVSAREGERKREEIIEELGRNRTRNIGKRQSKIERTFASLLLLHMPRPTNCCSYLLLYEEA